MWFWALGPSGHSHKGPQTESLIVWSVTLVSQCDFYWSQFFIIAKFPKQNPSEKRLGFSAQNFDQIEEKKGQRTVLLGWRTPSRFCRQQDCFRIWAHSYPAECTW